MNPNTAAEKLVELYSIINDAIAGEKDHNDLWAFGAQADKTWFIKEILYYLLREDVLYTVDYFMLMKILTMLSMPELKEPFTIIKISEVAFQTNIVNRINSFIKPAVDDFNNHQKLENFAILCAPIRWLQFEYKASLDKQTYKNIFRYLIKLISECDDSKTIKCAFEAFKEFPFENCPYFQQKLIELMAKQSQSHKHEYFCNFLNLKFNYLNKETLEPLTGYMLKLFEQSENTTVIVKAANAFSKFPENQMITFVPKVTRSLNRELQPNWIFHQNWLLVIETILDGIIKEKKLKLFNSDIMTLLFNYFDQLFCRRDTNKAMLSAVLLVEKFFLRKLFTNVQISSLKYKLKKQICDKNETIFLATCKSNDDYTRYQVQWCAQLLLDNNKVERMSPVKLSSDRLEARCSLDYLFTPVRSQFVLQPYEAYYYEATIVTNGQMEFGFSTDEANFKEEFQFVCGKRKIIDSGHSTYFNPLERNIRHNGKEYPILNQLECNPGDIVGCLIDMNNRRFRFYYNGKKIENSDEKNTKIYPFLTSYYATVILRTKQQCRFNFGPKFKFNPNLPYYNIYETCGGDKSLFQLSDTCVLLFKNIPHFWFKHSQVVLFYRDETQKKCDELMNCHAKQINNLKQIDKLENCFETEHGIRYIQAIIEMTTIVNDTKVDMLANWIGQVIAKMIDQMKETRLVELLYPYLKLNNSFSKEKHRNICIVLVHLIALSARKHDFFKCIQSEVFTYFSETFKNTADEWTRMFALCALGNLMSTETGKLNENVKLLKQFAQNNMKLLHREASTKKEKILFIQFKKVNPTDCLHSLSRQYRLVADHFLNYVHKCSCQICLDTEANLRTLDNTPDIGRTKYLKFSRDFLSARSDFGWQSVRSMAGVNDVRCYFEATLQTSGEMRIGWATKRTELSKTKVGDDEFSIAFDGYNRCVWHRAQKLPIDPSTEQWTFGDVIGCWIDVKRSEKNVQFSFKLNEKIIQYHNLSISYSDQSYYVAASLSAHQQVHFNFGNHLLESGERFEYPPKQSDYTYFYMNSVESSQPPINVINSKIGNAFINSSKIIKNENINLVTQQQTSSSYSNKNKQSLLEDCVSPVAQIENQDHSSKSSLKSFNLAQSTTENNSSILKDVLSLCNDYSGQIDINQLLSKVFKHFENVTEDKNIQIQNLQSQLEKYRNNRLLNFVVGQEFRTSTFSDDQMDDFLVDLEDLIKNYSNSKRRKSNHNEM